MAVVPVDKLPSEVLRLIFRYVGLETLAKGVGEVCHRFRDVSLDPLLWNDAVRQIRESIGLGSRADNSRLWFLKHLSKVKEVNRLVDYVVFLKNGANWPADVEQVALRVVELRADALDALRAIYDKPCSLAHYYWAQWLYGVVVRLEGVRRLLELSDPEDIGAAAVKEPLEALKAVYMVRNGRFPLDIMREGSYIWRDMECNHQNIISLVCDIKEQVKVVPCSNRAQLALWSSSLFMLVARRKLCWDSQIISSPICTYCYVRPLASEPLFVDFSSDGVLRSAGEIRDRFMYTGTRSDNVHFGVSIREILCISYAWSSSQISSTPKVLSLIRQAALCAPVPSPKQCPKLYASLVNFIIGGTYANFDEKRFSDMLHTSSDIPSGDLGKLCLIHGGDLGVIVEMDDKSCLVLKGSQLLRTLRENVTCTFNERYVVRAGLILPDVDVDLFILGQYFMKFDVDAHRFV